MSTGTPPLMFGVEALNITSEFHKRISPVILDSTWPIISRLLFLVTSSMLGCTLNWFFISSFFVEHTLKRLGYVFLACVGLADMLITTGIMPICTVVLLSGQWDNLPVCQTLQFLAITSTYCYSFYFLLVAADDYYRLCHSNQEYGIFLSMRIGLITSLIFCISCFLAACGVFMDFDYDYCEREHYGNFYFRITTSMVFHVVPGFITIVCMILSSIAISRRARIDTRYKRSHRYERDNAMNASNIVCYLLYVICWLPYCIIIYEYPGTSDNKYYGAAWIGILRSLITSFIYGTVNRSFRRAYAHLFNYCFCKSSMSSSFSGRHGRSMHYRRGTSDIKVHILHHAVNTRSTSRGTPAICETREL